jgi:hypothetical protein
MGNFCCNQLDGLLVREFFLEHEVEGLTDAGGLDTFHLIHLSKIMAQMPCGKKNTWKTNGRFVLHVFLLF